MADPAVRACLGSAPQGVGNCLKWKSLPKRTREAVRLPRRAICSQRRSSAPVMSTEAPVTGRSFGASPHAESSDSEETL